MTSLTYCDIIMMKDKLINSIFIIGMILVFITGVLGIIYEYVILDKTFIPEVIFTTTCILVFFLKIGSVIDDR